MAPLECKKTFNGRGSAPRPAGVAALPQTSYQLAPPHQLEGVGERCKTSGAWGGGFLAF